MAALPLHAAFAAEPVLLQGPNEAITAADIHADSQRMPEQMRVQVLTRPQSVQQIANNLYVRRVMADEASKLHLENSDAVQAELRVARDKVLSDAYLQRIDSQHTLSDAVALEQAHAMYTAHPERFKSTEQVHIRHILIGGTDEAAKTKAEEVLKELRAGGDFAALAQKYSTDTGSAAKGGDLGFFAHGRMVPSFEEAAFALKNVGDLSEPVKSQFGYHILQLQGKRPAGVQPFDDIRDALIAEIRAKAAQDARVAEAEKISAAAKPQTEAIEAFAKGYAPKK
ncbi:peptidylprolyl isomerase [Simplicispira hankyongi]|uniref:peptidylprolyl isomerase n=2 Tax=Simplicispira hankyongi TaxID=2315688 RepID=A0A398CGL4_9BURK|nr:peptidylprolyl isomerase [Simplicispira hankyongi]